MEYYDLTEPKSTLNYPVYSTEDPLKKYFEFRTNDSSNESSGTFVYSGTAVYYKIYNSQSTLSSHISTLDSLNTSTNTTAAATRMIESYGYQQLKLGTFSRNSSNDIEISSVSVEPLVAAASSNRTVNIRLWDYNEEYPAQVKIGSSSDTLADLIANAKPVRSLGNKSFFFYSDDFAQSQVPLSDDEDVQYTTSTTDDKTWYVNAYALAVGHDEAFTQYYSLLLHLGTITISSEDF